MITAKQKTILLETLVQQSSYYLQLIKGNILWQSINTFQKTVKKSLICLFYCEMALFSKNIYSEKNAVITGLIIKIIILLAHIQLLRNAITLRIFYKINFTHSAQTLCYKAFTNNSKKFILLKLIKSIN